jgi:hypothetical protein
MLLVYVQSHVARNNIQSFITRIIIRYRDIQKDIHSYTPERCCYTHSVSGQSQSQTDIHRQAHICIYKSCREDIQMYRFIEGVMDKCITIYVHTFTQIYYTACRKNTMKKKSPLDTRLFLSRINIKYSKVICHGE